MILGHEELVLVFSACGVGVLAVLSWWCFTRLRGTNICQHPAAEFCQNCPLRLVNALKAQGGGGSGSGGGGIGGGTEACDRIEILPSVNKLTVDDCCSIGVH